VALGGERKLLLGAAATVDVARAGAALDLVAVTAIGWQLVDAAHDQLPLLAMWLDAWAEHLVGDEVGDLVRHGLAQEVLGVLAIQLGVETQQVLVQMGDAGLLAAQLEAHLRPVEAAREELFGKLVAGLDTRMKSFGHRALLGSAALCQSARRRTAPADRRHVTRSAVR